MTIDMKILEDNLIPIPRPKHMEKFMKEYFNNPASDPRFYVITLCGSSKFKPQHEEAQRDLTLKGMIVIPMGVYGHFDEVELSENKKIMLDKMHKAKIDMSDAIFVIDVDNYVGSSTHDEIQYALENKKKVYYYSQGGV